MPTLQKLRLMRLIRYTDLGLGRSVLAPALVFRRDTSPPSTTGNAGPHKRCDPLCSAAHSATVEYRNPMRRPIDKRVSKCYETANK